MTTGKQFAAEVSNKKSKISRAITDIDSQIATTEREITRQNHIRSDALTRLADLYINDSGSFIGEFQKINGRLQALFVEKSNRRRDINLSLDGLQIHAKEIKEKVDSISVAINTTKDEIIQAESNTAAVLKNDAGFAALDSEINTLTNLINKDSNRLCKLEEDCFLKQKEFQQDIYFWYLYQLKYSTPEYHAGWFPKMDRWLAKICRYDENFQKYEILGLIPDRVRLANEARKRILEDKKTQRVNKVSEVENQYQVPILRKRLSDLEKALVERLNVLEQNNKKQYEYRKEKADLDSGTDVFIKKAKEELKNFFNTHSISELKAKAASTHIKDDDLLIAALESSEQLINEQRKKAKELIKSRLPLEEQLSKIRNAEYIVSRNNFDSSYSRFNNRGNNVSSVLDGFLLGSITQSVFESTLSRDHTEDRPRSSSSYSSYSSSSSNSSSSSDYSSGGGFDSGGDSGGSSSGGDF